MSQEMKERCHAITTRRGLNRRCKHTTLRGLYCWQHLKEHEGLRVKTSDIPGAKKGLFTTKDIPEGAIIAKYTGDVVVNHDPDFWSPYALQIKDRPPTFIDAAKTNTGEARFANDGRGRRNNASLHYNERTKKASLIADRDIEAGEEILTSYGDEYWDSPQAPKISKMLKRRKKLGRPNEYANEPGDNFIAEEDPVPKRKLVRPAEVEDEPMPIPWGEDDHLPPAEEAPWSNSEGEEYLPPARRTQAKPRKKKSVKEKRTARLDRSLVILLKDLVAMDEISQEKKLPGFDVPKQGRLSDDAYQTLLMRISTKAAKALMKSLKITERQLHAMIMDLRQV